MVFSYVICRQRLVLQKLCSKTDVWRGEMLYEKYGFFVKIRLYSVVLSQNN